MEDVPALKKWLETWKDNLRKRFALREEKKSVTILHVIPHTLSFWHLVNLVNTEQQHQCRVKQLSDIYYFEVRIYPKRIEIYAKSFWMHDQVRRVNLSALLSTSDDRLRTDQIHAFRLVVEDQIRDFHNTSCDSHCSFCGQQYEDNEVHLRKEVHHVLPFDLLMNMFCQQKRWQNTNKSQEEVELQIGWDRSKKGIDQRRVTLPPNLATSWWLFHREHAVMASVCRRCNLAAPTTRELYQEARNQGMQLTFLPPQEQIQRIRQLILTGRLE